MGIFDMTGLSQPGTGMLGNPLAGQGLLTGSGNPWLALIGQALRGGLAGAAAARGTKGFGAGLGVGSVAGVQSGYEAEANKRRNQALQQQIDYQNSEIQLRQQAAAEREAERQRTEAFISSLPPEQQGMARLAPKEVIAQQLKQMYPDDNAPKTVGGMAWDPTTKTFAPIPGYTDQAKAIAEAGRAPRAVTINQAQPLPKTIDERDQQILDEGQRSGNTSSFAYASAYQRTYGTKLIPGQDAQGRPAMIPWAPTPPAGLPQPTYRGPGLPPSQPSGAGFPQGPNAGAPPAAAAPGVSQGGGPGVTMGQPMTTGPAPNAKGLQTERAKRSLALDNLGTSIQQYEAQLKTTGPTLKGAVGLPTPGNMKLSSAYTSMLLELKELYNLGVLNGPDYDLMLKSIQDPNTIRGNLAGTDAMVEQLDLVKSKLAQARQNLEAEYGPNRATGNAPGAAQPAHDPLGIR